MPHLNEPTKFGVVLHFQIQNVLGVAQVGAVRNVRGERGHFRLEDVTYAVHNVAVVVQGIAAIRELKVGLQQLGHVPKHILDKLLLLVGGNNIGF
jgi:hypothetical protein